MPTIKQFLLPDPAEGLTEAEIVSWLVAVGDTVTINQPIVEIETAKSVVELPTPYAGVVVDIHVPAGQVAEVGTPIISIDVDPDGPAPAADPGADPAAAPAAETAGSVAPADSQGATTPSGTADENSPAPGTSTATDASEGAGRQPMLVGYGPKSTTPKRRPRRAWPNAFGPGSGVAASAASVLADEFSASRPVSTPVAPPRPPRPVQPVGGAGTRALPPTGEVTVPKPVPQDKARAKPPVRRLARELGVELGAVAGTGPGGLVTREDVLAAANLTAVQPAQPIGASGLDGGEERIPIAGVRKLTADAMVRSAFTAPHVTEWVDVDVTRSLELVETLRSSKDFADTKPSILVLVARALCLAVRRHPGINATWDGEAGQIVVKHYVNLGIAAATPRGLLVPTIEGAHRMDAAGLAQAISDLTRTAREGRTPPEAMAGGTITITNVGVFGVDGGTPIINPPQAAILAMGQVRKKPWVVPGPDGEDVIAVRRVMQLTLSFDHRLVDGDLGSKVLADVAAVLHDPALALAWA
ncbi:MAG: dihydrolipoamide acetyltransferase family protein [Actinomycetales bacterium]